MARKINYTPPAAHSCSRNQQQQGQQFTGCEHTDHLHKRFYFSSTRQLSLQACCLWTKMEQQFPKIGGPENRAQKSFQNWTYLLAEREEVFSLFYTLGSQIMTPKWAQNWDPKMGSKLLLQPLKPPQKHTHTHTHTQTHICRTEEQELQSWSGKKFFADLKLKTHFGGPDVRCQKFMVAGTPNSGPQTCSISYFWRLHQENQHTQHRDTRYRTTDDRKDRRTHKTCQITNRIDQLPKSQ